MPGSPTHIKNSSVEWLVGRSKTLPNQETDFDVLPTRTHLLINEKQTTPSTRSINSYLHADPLQRRQKKLMSHLFGTESLPHYLQTGSPIYLNENCPTPMSLMLHSSFGVERMKLLAKEIIKNDLHTSTYRDLLSDLRLGKCPPEGTIIVSIDDLGTNWLRPVFKDMIEVFTTEGLALVVGVIVFGPQNPSNWAYLRELDSLGVEVASHSVHHYNLPEVEPDTLEEEISGSYQTICEHLERCPNTLILPFGNRDPDGMIMQASQQYTFVIGIPGGTSFDGSPPFYLGRISPAVSNIHHTIQLLRATFSPQ